MVLIGFGAIPARAELQAGAAKVDITPDVKAQKIPLGGYAARRAAPATGVHDPVFARALVLADGKRKMALVSVDLCFLPANVKAEVAKRVQREDAALESEPLFISATHTHSAPDPLAMHAGNTFKLRGWTQFDASLLDFTAGKIAEAIVAAEKRLVPAKIRSFSEERQGLNRNRRGGPVTDPAMTVLKVTDAQGKAIAAIVDFAAHPTLLDDKSLDVSADWPGVMMADVEKVLGGETVCLFLNGAEGDASPNGVDNVAANEKVATYGHRVGEAANALLAKAAAPTDTLIAMWTQVVDLPPRKPSGLFVLAATQFGATFAQIQDLVKGLMPEKSVLTFARIGDTLLMGFPCEPSGELGLAAKAAARKAGYKLPVVVALTNDWLAYALTPAQYKQNNYETSMSFYGDQFGPTLLTALEAGLKAQGGAGYAQLSGGNRR